MTLKEAQAMKAVTENAIRELVQAFMDSTGLNVSNIDLNTILVHQVGQEGPRTLVRRIHLEVKL